MSEEELKPVLKAMCVFEKGGKILISKGFDNVKKENFFRFLGGHIEEGELPEEGIRREIMEEIGSEILNLKLIDTIESRFTYQGKDCHEIVSLFSGDLENEELYKKGKIHIVDGFREFDAYWVSIQEIFDSGSPIYPKLDYKNLLKNI